MEIEFTYTIDAQAIKTGIKKFAQARTPIRRFLLPAIGVLLIYFSISEYMMAGRFSSFATILGLLGVLYLFLPKISTTRAVKAAMKGRKFPMSVKMIATETGLECITPDASSTSKWESFVATKNFPQQGFIIFPQKNLHLWIPADAKFTTGNWESFTNLATQKIQNKL